MPTATHRDFLDMPVSGVRRIARSGRVCVVNCARVATRRIVMRSADRDALVAIAVCERDFDLHPTRSDDRRVED